MCYVTGTENVFLSAWVKCLGVNVVIQAIYCHHRRKMRNYLPLPLIRDPSIGLEKTTRQTLARMMVLSMQLSKSLKTPYILSQCKLSPLNLVDDKVHMAQWSKFVHLSDLPVHVVVIVIFTISINALFYWRSYLYHRKYFECMS